MHKKLSKATGGMPLVPPTWTLGKYLVTPHPLGGCNMGATRRRRRRRPQGRGVRLSATSYVLDGAHRSRRRSGVNPSRTIAALAEHAAGAIVAEGR